MRNYVREVSNGPLVDLLMPWKNFTRMGPLLWVFLGACVSFFIGVSTEFLELFAWVGGFIVLLFVAVAVSLFETL